MEAINCYNLLKIYVILIQVSPGWAITYHGSWEKWSDWSECSVTCGYGSSTRYRKWKENGILSEFTFRDIRECWIEAHCPVHGSWGPWTDWDLCSSMCNGGTQQRERVCNHPMPQHSGRDCMGAKWEVKECNKVTCPTIPPHFKLSSCDSSSHFICESRKHCVSRNNRCDGKLDCHDGTDEKKCLFFAATSSDDANGSISFTRDTGSFLLINVVLCFQTVIYAYR